MVEGGSKGKASGVLDAAADKVEELVGGRSERDDDEEREERPRRRPRQRATKERSE